MPFQRLPCSIAQRKNQETRSQVTVASCVHWQLRAAVAANALAPDRAVRPPRLVSVEPPVVVVVALHMSLAAQ